jgi:hypothetical protein
MYEALDNAVYTIRSLFMRNERVSAVSIGAVMLLAVVLMGLVSLTVLNDKSSKGYLLSKLEGERQELVTDGEITDMLTLRARSMTVIEEKTYGMVKPERQDIYYVTPVSVVAAR